MSHTLPHGPFLFVLVFSDNFVSPNSSQWRAAWSAPAIELLRLKRNLVSLVSREFLSGEAWRCDQLCKSVRLIKSFIVTPSQKRRFARLGKIMNCYCDFRSCLG